MRKLVGEDLPRTKEEIKLCASCAYLDIDKDTVTRAILNFPIRTKALLQFGGSHFEHSLDKFKRGLGRKNAACTTCDRVHCDCLRCNNSCTILHESKEELAVLPDTNEADTMDAELGAYEEL